MRPLLDSAPVRFALIAALAALLLGNYLFGRLAIERASYRLPGEQTSHPLPASPALRALSLNYSTAAADLAWIATIVRHGERGSRGASPYLFDDVTTLNELDPFFFRAYEWFPAVHVQVGRSTIVEDIARANLVLDRGMKVYPARYELPYLAGMNFIGYTNDAPPEQRLREADQAIRYFQRASLLPNAPSNLPFVVAWFYNRKRQWAGEVVDEEAWRAEQIAFFIDVYLTTSNPNTRQALEFELRSLGVTEAEIERRVKLQAQAFDADGKEYLPVALRASLL